MEYEKLARGYRKKPVVDLNASTAVKLDYDREAIKKLLPHRSPFLLIDRIIMMDLKEIAIGAKRYIDPGDPVFTGHFPDYPIYPGVLQIEMIGQLAVCAYSFTKLGTTEIKDKKYQFGVRALKVFHTLFQSEVLPGDEVDIYAKFLDQDEFKFKGIGQVVKGEDICTITIGEFYIV
jgi:3-hydroxyacyl-[acyl-carrier-protein] dehydratase